MSGEDLEKYYLVLELPADASYADIHNSYRRLKKLYSNESIVLTPLGEEFSEKKRKQVLEQVEEAYSNLLAAKKNEPSRTEFLLAEEPSPEKVVDLPTTGLSLRKIREKAGIELKEISKELKLRMELLKSLEEEKFEALPEASYLKVHLKNYVEFLGLNPATVIDEYLSRYRTWKEKTIAEK